MLGKFTLTLVVAAALAAGPGTASAKDVRIGIVAFQMSSETHARVANAAAAAVKELGWKATVLNSRGDLNEHASQIENLVRSRVDGIILAMTKPLQFGAQLKEAKDAGIPVITVMSGSSPYTLFDIQVNEYKVGAEAALYLLDSLNYQGNILEERFEGNEGTRIRGKILDVVLSENKGIKVLGTHSMARTKSWRDDVKSGMEALLLQNQGKVDGIWASFDGQAFIIDDLLQARGVKKGQIKIISIDGGQETFRRIRDPNSVLTATVAIPFEKMGRVAVDSLRSVIENGETKKDIVRGPYLYQDAVLVTQTNVPPKGEWPW